MPSIEGGSIVDEDLLTVVAVNEADPSLRNKKFQFDELVVYLDQYFQNQTDNTFSGDIIVGGNATISGLTTTSGLTVTHAATVSGLTVQDDAIVSGTISGDTISGHVAYFNQAETQTGTVVTLTGTTFTYSTGIVTSYFSGAVITGETINGLNVEVTNLNVHALSGNTITGNTLSITSGVFTNITGTSIQSNRIDCDTGVFHDLTAVNMTFQGDQTISGNFTIIENLTVSGGARIVQNVTGEANLIIEQTGFIEEIVTSGTISGATITGDLIQATTITGVSGVYTYLSGATITGDSISGTSGVYANLSGASITGDLISGTSGVYTYVSGTSITGNLISGTSGVYTYVSGTSITGNLISGTSGVYTYVSGTSITGDLISGTSGIYTNLSGATITGDLISGTSGVFVNGAFDTISISGLTISTGLFASGTAAAPSITFVDDVDTGIYSPAANELAISTSGTGRVFVDDSGNVGIGTSSPQYTFDVESPNTNTDETVAAFGNQTIHGGLEVITNGNLNWGFNALNSRNLVFETNQTESMRITSSGNVGIGTSSPTQKLDVAGNIKGELISGTSGVFTLVSGTSITGNLVSGTSGVFTNLSGTTITGNTIQATSGVYGNISGTTVTGTTVNAATLNASTGTITNFGVTTTLTGVTAIFTTGEFTTITGVTGVFTTLLSGASITGDLISGTSGIYTYLSGTSITGNLISGTSGVFTNVTGTTVNSVTGNFTTATLTTGLFASGTAAAPSITFVDDVDTGLSSPAANEIAISTSGTGRVFIDDSGNFGIGTSSPQHTFDLKSSNSNTDETVAAFGNQTIQGGLEVITNGNLDWGFNAKNSRNLVFETNQSENMRITSNGNIGIGTSSPGDKLEVNGTAAADNYKETVYTITWSSGFALNPTNGETQFVVLGGNSTPTQSSWDNGESITLHIDDGTAYTITWTTLGVVWTGGSAPTLATTGDTVVQLWKAGSVIYGALVGEVA